ncbi:MAG TPA: ABC transporter ATP-binding protein [Thermotogota bacterium]|mgnify:CR=1 FL=1|nr:ABC transporter ATP-binding protein [Thermotogota bacterium]HPJ87809.1 ABC transporter ATP-binding protein [Thermotogota bacterium]HPR95193.1 ABC transporter ATP-binding protein [Thermotogota bacterium]
MSILELNQVTSGYGSAIVLEELSLTIEEGECLAVLGPNGAGKSTLLKTITGTVVPKKGTIHYLGEEITGLDTYKIVRKGISLSPENRRLFRDLSVMENLTLGGLYGQNKENIDQEIKRVFEIFPRLEERKSQLANTMSGGEQQMVAIARAMTSKPKILLLDEPSMGLAHIIKEQIFEGIQKIKELGMTILIVEQDATMVMPIADKVAILEHGKILKEDTPENIQKDNYIRDAYLGVG